MTELLAPAGDMERLKTSLMYGADAVYLGGMEFGLRKGAINFSNEELREAVRYVHERKKRLHVTLNIVPHDEDLHGLNDYIKFLDEIGVDAVIVSDPGIFTEVKNNSKLEIHISTQGSVTNALTARFWYNQGAKRIVLARELSIEEIKNMRKQIPDDLELEAFCHGAMCMSYSGRCLISSYMTGRDPNRGDCAHPCRYKYHLVEEKRPGEYYPIEETDGGTYIMNSRDLNTINFVDKLIEAGVSSLKIEGRVKSPFYIATVLRAYRKAIDEYNADPKNYVFNEEYAREILMSSHRPFTDGFYFGDPKDKGQFAQSSASVSSSQYKGDVLRVKDGRLYLSLKNGINEGDEIQIMGPDYINDVIVDGLRDEDGRPIDRANVPNAVYSFSYDGEGEVGYYLRRVVEK